MRLSAPYFKNKVILVTGGTGTFGYAFITKILKESKVKKVIVFSRDEFKQWKMREEFFPFQKRLRFFLGDVRDLSRLERAFDGVNFVIHAAALKQVPAVEYNPTEAIKTNILGTQNVIEAALNKNIEKVLLISSDKAVHPINLYGATKLCAEKLIIGANAYCGRKQTKFSVVRYGNVIGSRGSFIELINSQRPSGVITLTDTKMTRFWIKINEVMNIIFNILEAMKGGEIFVPKMKSAYPSDVVKAVASECAIKIIGIRPGEKMHEILIAESEIKRTRDAGYFFVIEPEFDWAHITKWYKNKLFVPKNFSYISNCSEYLLDREEAQRIFKTI